MKLLFGIIVCVQVYTQTLAHSALPKCTDKELFITVDRILLELYIDGLQEKNLPNYNRWVKADNVTIPALAQVVAVKAGNAEQVGGILGSAGNFVTDACSWKCTIESHDGWMNVSFDDSEWPVATSYGQNKKGPWKKIDGINASAYWIWTADDVYRPTSDKEVYCRARFPACDSCEIKGTGPKCIRSCTDLPNGDYQSCKGCNFYATCTYGHLSDQRPCAPSNPPLVWDDEKKSCRYNSSTCTACFDN